MSLKIDILTAGSQNLTKLLDTFGKLPAVLSSSAKGFKNLSKSEQETVRKFENLTGASQTFVQQLNRMTKAMTQVEKASIGLKHLNVPFTKLEGSVRVLKTHVSALNMELIKTSQISARRLKSSGTMKIIQEYKASIDLQKRLNAEIEKQARLTADIALAGGGSGNKVLLAEVANIKKAEEATKKLVIEKERLIAVNKQMIAGQKALADITKGLTVTGGGSLKAQAADVEKLQQKLNLLKTIKLPAGEFDRLSASIKKAGTALEIPWANQQKVIAGINQEIAALEKMVVVDEKAAAAMVKLKATRDALRQGALAAQINKDTKSLDAQAAAIDKLKSRTDALKNVTLPTGKYQQLQKEIKALNTQLEMTGKSQRAGIAGINQQVAAYEKLAATQAKAAAAFKTMISGQVASVDKLKSRLKSLEATKFPVAQAKMLKKEISALNVALARTGTSQAGGIGRISSQLTVMEKKFRTAGKSALDFNTNLKYAAGGIARSLGAMTYSYASLAPLLAGIAIGTAIKKVYELGTAFEYATTFVSTLDESINGLDASGIQEQLLGFETLRKGPVEMAAGMKEFAKAGVTAAESMGQIGELTKFATIAELELGEAVKLVVGQKQAFGITFAAAANMMGAAALSSATDIKEIGTALAHTTELATVSGTKFHEVATAMAVMANAGIRGGKAGTALRTSILKMQNPTEKLKGMLDDLGISWSAFTEGGQIKDLRTMFTELQRITTALPSEQKVAVLKELFGLRALKGGANLLRAQGDEWDNLNAKIKASALGVTFITEKYEELSDTVQAKKEVLGAEFEKSLLKAFSSDKVKSALDNLTTAVASPAFVSSITSVVESLDELIVRLTRLISMGTKLKTVGDFFSSFAETDAVGIMKSITAEMENMLATPGTKGTLFGDLLEKDLEIIGYIGNKIDALKGKFSTAFDTGAKSVSVLEKEIEGLKDTIAETYKEGFSITGLVGKLEVKQVELDIAKAVEEGTTMAEVELREKLVEVKDRLQLEIDKKEMVLALRSITVKPEAINIAALKVDKEIKILDLEQSIAELDGWEKKLAEVDKQVQEFIREKKLRLGWDQTEIDRFRDYLTKNAIDEGIAKIQQATDDLNFDTMVNGLLNSADAADKLSGEFLKLKNEAFEFIKAAGDKDTFKIDGEINFSVKGQEYFDALVSSSGIFQKAVTEAKKSAVKIKDEYAKMVTDVSAAIEKANQDFIAMQQKIVALQASITGDLTSVLYEGLDPEEKLADQKKRIEEYREAAQRAFDSGNMKEYQALLGKAYDISKNLATIEFGASAENVTNVKTMAEKEAEILQNVTNAAQKYNLMKEIGEARLKGLEAEKDAIGEQIGELESVKQGYTELLWEAEDAVEMIELLGIQVRDMWSDTAGAIESSNEVMRLSVLAVTQEVSLLNQELKKLEGFDPNVYSPDYVGTLPPEQRAVGGPTTANTPYIVGEKGPELFIPNTNGNIVPNDSLRDSLRSGSSDVTINNYINQALSNSEIEEITVSQERTAARI